MESQTKDAEEGISGSCFVLRCKKKSVINFLILRQASYTLPSALDSWSEDRMSPITVVQFMCIWALKISFR